jgi:hypothetical protein
VNEASAVGPGTGEAAPSGSPGVPCAARWLLSMWRSCAGEYCGLRITSGNSKRSDSSLDEQRRAHSLAAPRTARREAVNDHASWSLGTAAVEAEESANKKNMVGQAASLPR